MQLMYYYDIYHFSSDRGAKKRVADHDPEVYVLSTLRRVDQEQWKREDHGAAGTPSD